MSKECEFCKGKYITLPATSMMLDWMCMRIVEDKLVFSTSSNKGLSWVDRSKRKINYCPICGSKLTN